MNAGCSVFSNSSIKYNSLLWWYIGVVKIGCSDFSTVVIYSRGYINVVKITDVAFSQSVVIC